MFAMVKTKMFIIVVVGMSISFFAGCASAIGAKIQPTGGLTEPVNFRFYTPAKAIVGELRVQREIEDGSWATVWEIKSGGSLVAAVTSKRLLAAIQYGEELRGFEVLVPPEPLEKNINYRVWFYEATVYGTNGGEREFYFSDTGTLVIGRFSE